MITMVGFSKVAASFVISGVSIVISVTSMILSWRRWR